MGQIIVNDIGLVVEKMRVNPRVTSIIDPSLVGLAPFYMFGHRVEINDELMAKSKDMVFKYQKYPLVALRLDTIEDNADGYIEFSLNIAILHKTEKNYNTKQRYENVFIPILYPLYEAFLKALRRVGLFTWEGYEIIPPHKKVDRPYWGIGGNEGNTANIFSDPIDAIEIIDLKIKKRQDKC